MIKAASRPAIIDRDSLPRLDAEMRAARWLYHRLLDFEDSHEQIMAVAAEESAPGIGRTARIVARLLRRQKRRERSSEGTWSPNPHPAWLASLRVHLSELRNQRNGDPRWKMACQWADKPAEDAPDRTGARRKATETDDEFAARLAKRRTKLTRREAYRKALYDAHVASGAAERSRVYWGTWNQLTRSVDQARKAVIQRRKEGLPAEWRRPRWDEPLTIAADSGGFRIVDRVGGTRTAANGATIGNPWWTIETRTTDGWVRLRAKIGNWHALPEGSELRTLKLTRRRNGNLWDYSVSISVNGMPEPSHPGTGVVALDWGHREHGHPTERLGIRVFAWRGDDGKTGEILLPAECRELLDHVNALKSRVDSMFVARKSTLQIPERNRYGYRSRLMRDGVRSEEETAWLRWEMRYERRMARARRRIDDLRRETYTQAIRELRQRYRVFALEDETIMSHRRAAVKDMTGHRKRQNRELSARYEFIQLCERSGAEVLPVPARNSTRECPSCGYLCENGPELEIACTSCGLIRDKDFGACETIFKRAQEALANRAA